ncbi:cilia- and flagella-associated protein 91-like [Leptidea sinapis]|uniref:cilia- and flagella-associated protein 91-like n=1 Tax=Leptidea sinapis TaxID=189913 RepID=UPI00212F4A93|nr:cilia- and flagella-associated protein 91-like [Leptidea sinapis]
MSGETLYESARKQNVTQMRVHDYLYDSVFIVSGARDYARTAFRAAMASAQVAVHPVYKTMFSELRKYPRVQVVYHPNCRLPTHIDRSYGGYLQKVQQTSNVPTPNVGGKDRFKFTAVPKKLLDMKTVTPRFQPPVTQTYPVSTKPRNRGTQSVFRESSAQTSPWQPDGKAADVCETTPEVLYLDNLNWGPGDPYRSGDLPADFHTTEIINKMRHARRWGELVEKAQFPRWMKKQDGIITDIETKDWIFREAEIDELQDIRLTLLHKMQAEQRQKQITRISKKLSKLWTCKKNEMEKKIENIRRSRDRELRKLAALHSVGGRAGVVEAQRATRGGGSVTTAARDPTSDLHAPKARHGYQARRRHAEITYDPSLLAYEDHERIAAPPAWLEQCGQNLGKSCSGHHLPQDKTKLCERETKWSEKFLESLHNDLKKARLGASEMNAGPLRVLKPRRLQDTPRPATPVVEEVKDEDEASHQAALVLQKIIRGRAVQNLMFEGRTRAAELTEELKTTHGLQKEDRVRIEKEETKARDFNALRTEAEQKEDAIAALVGELCGSAVSAALDFLEKELRRLREERRHHAYILIALRDKSMREAAEAGRRQREVQRRREHDEMFKQVLGITQETVDAYLSEILQQGVELAAEEQAVARAKESANRVDLELEQDNAMSTAEQNELVAELVHQFLLPEAHKAASRHRLAAVQHARMDAARSSIFGLVDDAEIKDERCIQCGELIGLSCRCEVCPLKQDPVMTSSRDDPRWKKIRAQPRIEKTREERIPPAHDIRCWLNDLIGDVAQKSKYDREDKSGIVREMARVLRERPEITIDAREILDEMVSAVTGDLEGAIKAPDYGYVMTRVIKDALERSVPFDETKGCPTELPSEIRRKAQEAAFIADPTCYCEEKSELRNLELLTDEEKSKMMPSEWRTLEEMRRCKCDPGLRPSPVTDLTTEPSLIEETIEEEEELP